MSEASAELDKSLMNKCDWCITGNDVKHMEITDWQTNIYTVLKLIVLIKVWTRGGLLCFCEPPSQWCSPVIAGENTSDARRQLTWCKEPAPAAGFMQVQGCTHMQPSARSGPMGYHSSMKYSHSGLYVSHKTFNFQLHRGWWGGGVRASVQRSWWNSHPVTTGFEGLWKV